MLGEYALEGIEAIESAERRALVEHRVPGMEGSYLQDLGSAPNAILIAGTRHGDEARDAFLEQVRTLFKTGAPTTFTADINTSTDLTDVVIDDLQVAELAGAPDSFRYVVRLRKYTEPPEPAAAGLAGIDSDLLDEAGNLVGALDALDALLSAPNLGDPTPPLRDSLGGVRDATGDLGPAAAEAEAGLGAAVEGAGEGPTPEELSDSLAGVQGDAEAGTGMAGALSALNDADVPGQRTELIGRLDGALAGALPAAEDAPAGEALERLGAAAGTLPDPAELSAPLAEPLDAIAALAGPDAAGAVPEAIATLSGLGEQVTEDPATVLEAAASALGGFEESALGDSLGVFEDWSATIAELVAALEDAPADLARERLFAFLREQADELARGLVPGGSPVRTLELALEAAASDQQVGAVRGFADQLAAAVAAVRSEATAGRVPSAAQVTAANDALAQVAGEAAALAVRLEEALGQPAASPDALARALTSVHAGLQDVEVVDFGNPAGAVRGAFEELRALIAELDLAGLIAPAQAPLRGVADALDELELDRLTQGLDEAQAGAEEALAKLDGAALEVLASVRAALEATRGALAEVTSVLGEVGDDGRFHFHAEAEIQDLLQGAHDVIANDIEPALASFRTAVHDAMAEVTAALQSVTAELEAAKQELQAALEEATAQLETIDVTAMGRELSEQLVQTLDSLVDIDLDAVVDPVVAAIGEMRDELRAIDPESLNDVLRAALAAGLALLSLIDFPEDITAVLMAELDELLQEPLDALSELQGHLDGAVSRFSELDPSNLAAPLHGVFQPVTSALDELNLDVLAGPLEEWYASAREALDTVMPEALLAPVVAAYDDLVGLVGSVSADAVAGTLEELLAQASGELERLEPAVLVSGLSEQVGHARELVDSFSPAAVLAPLTEAHAQVAARIAQLDPAALLEPLGALRRELDAALEGLTQADAEQAAAALEPLRVLAEGCDPERAFAAAAAATTATAGRLAALDLEGVLARVRSDQREAAEELREAGQAAVAERVDALDPLGAQAPEVAETLTRLRRLRTTLGSAYPAPEPPAELAGAYGEVRPVVDALVPVWAQGTPTVEGLRAAFAWADPAAIGEGLRGVHQELIDQWNALDPRVLAQPLDDIHVEVSSALAAVDPQAIADRVDEVIGGVAERLAGLDLSVIREEGGALAGDVTSLVEGLDPRPTIERLTGLADDVRRLVDQLDPAALLAELQAPVDAAREIVEAVDPAAIAEVLEPAFQRIRAILEGIDLTEALRPLLDRLDALRDELESALGRTERAFRELVAAIPH